MAGSNTISVYVKNSDGTGEVSSTAPAYTVSPATVPAIVVNSLAPSAASPATAGASVSWTASATGGSGTYQYQFSRMGPDTSGAFVVAQGWGSSSSWNWATTSSMAGTNTIMVSVRNSDGSGTVTKSVTYAISQVVTAIVIGSISPSVPTPDTVGAQVTWTASATGGSGTYQYQFSRTGPDTGGTAVVAQAWGTSKTWNWTPTSSMVGSNTITVGVRNSDGTGQVTSTAPAYTVSSVVNPAIVVNSLVPSAASPATAGASVSWTASATGGSGTYQYQFSRTGPDTSGSYVVAQGWGGSSSWNWATTSSMAGTNTVMVSVRNSDGSGTVTKSVTYSIAQVVTAIVIGSMSPSMPSPDTVGTPVTWTASASGGSGTYQYQFSRTGPDTGGTAVVAQAWGTSKTWNWGPTSAMVGSNTISVGVRNSDGTGQVTSTAPAYTVSYAPIAASSLTANPSTTTAGASVTLTASATGGSGSYQYQFSRKGPDTGGSSIVVQAYGASNSWNWATSSVMAGSNTISVSVKDSTGATATVSSAYTLSASTPPPLSDPLTASPTSATAGTTVTCTSTASGGSGGYQYQFSRSGPDTGGSFVVTQAYGTSNTWNWATTSAMAGSNTIKVTVKDSSGATTTDSTAYTLASATTTGNSYYMSPSGSDSGSGTITSPWATISYASSKLKPGDTLYARGGTYYGQNGGTWPTSGTSSAWITFKAYPGETPIFDGNNWAVDLPIALYYNTSSYLIFDGLTFRNSLNAFYIQGQSANTATWPHDVIVQNCTFLNIGNPVNNHHDQVIYAYRANNLTFRNNLTDTSDGAFLQCYGYPNDNVSVYNNVIKNCQWGVIFTNSATNIQVYNNTIDSCRAYGISLYSTGDNYGDGSNGAGVINFKMMNNIITNTTGPGLIVCYADQSYQANNFTSDYNLFYGNSTDVQWGTSNGGWANYSLAQFKANTSQDQHSITANSSYVSPSTDNYQLNSGSPALSAGSNLYSIFTTDSLGNSRPQSGSWAMGAFQN